MRRRRLSQRARLEIMERQGYRCACGCDQKLDGQRTEVDHRLPLALGGTDTLDNLQVLIDGHHREKTRADKDTDNE